ncbi:MAG: hypothetical protein V2J51_06685 [Erythrobacter sp.]|jgi:hypothetical protein|nr:hypothetical protein [Erythrobacter sp.]
MIRIARFDTSRFAFDAALRAILDVGDLTRMQSDVRPPPDWSIYKAMEHSALYRRLTGALLGEEGRHFRALYHRFIREEIALLHQRSFLYQACPTVRLHFRDALGAERFHRDIDYGHDPREVNYCLAVTAMFGANAIWIESAPGANDHAPLELEAGEYARFDGANCSHGTRRNITRATRVSFDFRVLEEAAGTGLREISESDPPERLDARIMARCAI